MITETDLAALQTSAREAWAMVRHRDRIAMFLRRKSTDAREKADDLDKQSTAADESMEDHYDLAVAADARVAEAEAEIAMARRESSRVEA